MELDVICKAEPKKAASLECTGAVNDSTCPEADGGQLAEIKLPAISVDIAVGSKESSYLEDLLALNCQDGRCDSPGGGSHDAASAIHRHPAAATPFRRVVVHSKVVSELVGQRDCSAQGVVRMVLQRKDRSIMQKVNVPFRLTNI